MKYISEGWLNRLNEENWVKGKYKDVRDWNRNRKSQLQLARDLIKIKRKYKDYQTNPEARKHATKAVYRYAHKIKQNQQ